jgi:hypothetical protein
MATVYELLDSRQGGTRGNDGAQGHGRSFHVTTDSVNDDPSAVIQATPCADTGEVVSIGASHPWGAYGIVVTNLREAERMTQTQWIVDAIYGVPLVPDPTRPWDISVDVSLDTYTAYVDLDGQVIGPAVYHPVPREEDYPGERLMQEVNRLRDKEKFDTTSVNPFFAPISSGWQALYKLQNSKRRAIGLPRTRKVANFALSKVLPRLAASQIGAVQAMVNTINATTFWGASKEKVKFVGMRARSGPGVMTGQTVPNVVWAVELLFAIDWDGHNPMNEYDLYEHKDGTQGVIEDSQGKPVKRTYRLYEKLEFNTILSWLER